MTLPACPLGLKEEVGQAAWKVSWLAAADRWPGAVALTATSGESQAYLLRTWIVDQPSSAPSTCLDYLTLAVLKCKTHSSKDMSDKSDSSLMTAKQWQEQEAADWEKEQKTASVTVQQEFRTIFSGSQYALRTSYQQLAHPHVQKRTVAMGAPREVSKPPHRSLTEIWHRQDIMQNKSWRRPIHDLKQGL